MIIHETDSSILRDTFWSMPDPVRRMLGLLDNDEQFAWLIWWCPDDADRMSNPEHAEDVSEPLTELIDVQAAHEPRHPAELFTADQAAPVFMHHVEHQTVPDGYTLRLIADM